MTTKPVIQFWFEFASTYSYPAAMRIDRAAAAKGVEVEWRPFVLGPIFASQGWKDSPFNLYPVKGDYMKRDLERTCAELDLPFALPQPFPQNSLLCARIAAALEGALRQRFAQAVYQLEFGEGRTISDPLVAAEALRRAGLDPAFVDRAQDDSVKQALRAATEEAQKLGVFGAPTFVTADGELFWGNDRLEQALDWALKGHL
ncbi:2-hydroxychromene-2-carboxylate isomerase [Terricaulis sp.]|uniref:2-hydroxychromene-2-carboxylate isomerase n=1 Tax=Terricaulis sp. TaxID=2768686 RepID=UPI0037848461